MKTNHFKKFLNVLSLIYTYSNCMVYRLFYFWQISEIRVNLWKVYTCNMKGLEEVENIGRRWMYFALLTKITRDQWLWCIILESLKVFSWWQTHDLWDATSKMEEYFSPISGKGKGKLLFELGTKEIKKLKSCHRVDEQEPSVQSVGKATTVQSWRRGYINLPKPRTDHLYLVQAINNPPEEIIQSK